MSTDTKVNWSAIGTGPDVCPICGITLWAWRKKRHRCPPSWWCWAKDQEGSGRLVYAYHQYAAATKYAERLDQERIDDGDPPMCDKGVTVLVAERKDKMIQAGEIEVFYVWAELEPRYKARNLRREGNGTA